MKRQKICIIGGSLTGLVTAICLSRLNCEIDLITGSIDQNYESNRTTAVSDDNLNFLKELDIFKSVQKELWPCSEMKLYTEIKNEKNSEILELNNSNKQKKILYMVKNSTIKKLMINKIKKIKSISFKTNQRIDKINTSGLLRSIKFNENNSKYNLVILCTGSDSSLVKILFKDQLIKSSYEEKSITTILNHNYLKNNTARQFFLDDEILALLPISNTRTSIVWSVKKNKYKAKDSIMKEKIKFNTKNYLKDIKFLEKIEYKDLGFLIRNKYYHDRILLFGDALHVVHPFVGQGFNMTLRDLSCLKKILSEKINLGLDIGSSDILHEYSNQIKPRNFMYSIGIYLIKNSFSLKNNYIKKIRNNFLKILNKNNVAKDVFFNLADKGLKF